MKNAQIQHKTTMRPKRVSHPLLRTVSPARAFWHSMFFVLVVGALDYVTGNEISFSLFYLIPVSLATWHLGKRIGLLFALSSAALWFLLDAVLGSHTYNSIMIPIWNSLVRLGFFSLMSISLSGLREKMETIEAQREELTAAYNSLDANQREQIMLRDRLLSNVSHELRTPLTAIHQFVSLLHDGIGGTLSDSQREYTEIALRNIAQLNRMIADLLDSTRINEGKLTLNIEPVSIQPLLRDAAGIWSERASQRGVSICVTEVQEATAAADPMRVKQVLANLIDNAIRFTPAGGRIALSAKAGPMVEICVSDTGPGIPAESQEHIFDRLYQAADQPAGSRKGLGLGLFISREIVAAHGGTIRVDSVPGHGAAFRFTLPTVNNLSSQEE